MRFLSANHPGRRDVVRSLIGGSLMLPGVLSHLLAAEESRPSSIDPLAPKQPHFLPRAKRVIFLFSTGGVSHMDTFVHGDVVRGILA